MKSIHKITMVLIVGVAIGVAGSVFAIAPALAITVVDGSDQGISANDLAKILSIMAPLKADLAGLRQVPGRGNERYYCGRIRQGNDFVPFLVNIFADQKYVLSSPNQDTEDRLKVMGCLPVGQGSN
jgi:hypothetical protein